MPKVSVIVPNYNHSRYLQQRIDSIINQTYQDFELILLDDCSTDNSQELLSEYANHPKVTYCIFNNENSGSTFKQWDKGIQLAKGDYIWIAESDDWADSTFLETIMKETDKYPDAGLLFTASKLVDNENDITYQNNINNSGDTIVYDGISFISKKLSVSNIIWNASMMVFKKALYPKEYSDLFTRLKFCGDWFFYVLISEKTNVMEIRQTLNFFRIHKQNVSTEAEKSGKSFSEGLIVYDYIQDHHLSFIEKLKSAFVWGKSFYKYQRKFDLPPENLTALSLTIRQHNRLIYVNYLLYKLLKTL